MQSPLSPPIEAEQRALALRINAALPQTQCRRCGYPDCAGYAAAVAADAASIDRCPPGGIEGIARLAELTGRARVPLDPVCGEEAPRQLAVVDEAWCIGCTLCIQACPTDAIIGAPKAMHTVVESRCTGCALCLPVCPVDCIALENASGNRTGWNAWSAAQAEKAREDYRQRTARLQRDAHIGRLQRDRDAQAVLADLTAHSSIADEAVLARKREAIEAALARARTRAASTAATR